MENQDKRRLNDEQTILDPETARIPVPMDEKQQGKAEAQGAKKNKKTGASNAIYGAAGGVVGAAAGIGGSQLFGQGPDEPIEEVSSWIHTRQAYNFKQVGPQSMESS